METVWGCDAGNHTPFAQRPPYFCTVYLPLREKAANSTLLPFSRFLYFGNDGT